MKATLVIEDEVNCKFNGIDPATRRKMSAAVRYFVPSAFHSAAYKLGRWDGYMSFCGIGGQTQILLLEKILPVVIDAGYEIDIIDNRVEHTFNFTSFNPNTFADKGYVWPKGHERAGEPIVLRDYQVESINEFISNYHGINQMATGSGKCLDAETMIDIEIDENSDFGKFLINTLATGAGVGDETSNNFRK